MSDTTKVDELTDLPDNHGNRLAMDRGLLDELLAVGARTSPYGRGHSHQTRGCR
jgi:hypothetical protein